MNALNSFELHRPDDADNAKRNPFLGSEAISSSLHTWTIVYYKWSLIEIIIIMFVTDEYFR